MAFRVLYVSPLALYGNPAMDAIAYGLQHILHAADIELCVLFADFTAPDYRRQYEDAIAAGIAARVDAIVIYVITPSAFRRTRRQGSCCWDSGLHLRPSALPG